jgi:NAD+ kinase
MDDFSVPVLTVNRGAVGFLAEMTVEEAPLLLPQFLKGEGWTEERRVLDVCAKRGEKILYDGFVLNEAVISQGSIARLVDLKTTVAGEDLTTFRADGLIIATPTGSTAYTLAAGGPIVHPEIGAVILTPINSHTFSQKPIVVPASHAVDVEVLTKKNKFGDVEVSLTLDGQTYVKLCRHDKISVSMRDTGVKFLRRGKETFYGTLRTKLKWGERPED